MKKVAVFVGLALLISVTCNVFCAGPSGKRGHPRGIPQGPVSVYDNRGQIQQTIKRDSSGNEKVYDNRGQPQESIKYR